MATTAPGRNFKEVDFNNIVIPPLQKKDQRKTCTPFYKDPKTNQTSPLCIQTPPVRLPFGFSKNDPSEMKSNGGGGKVQYSINPSFEDQPQGIAAEWYDWCQKFELFGIATASHNSESWFDGNEKLDAKMCKMLFNKWVKRSKDPEKAKKYPPTFKGTVREKLEKDAQGNIIPSEKKAFWTKCFEPDGKTECDITSLRPNDVVSMKLKLTTFYVINGKFGFTWDVEWVVIVERASGGTLDYNPNMYGQLPAPAVPPAQEPTENAAVPPSEGSVRDEASSPTADEVSADGKRTENPVAAEEAASVSSSSSKRQRKN
jgi:hypothetical protein